MKDEFNQYHITNPDGVDKRKYDENKISFSNDSSRFVRENSLSDLRESMDAKESFDFPESKKKGASSQAQAQTTSTARASSASLTTNVVKTTITSSAAGVGGVTAIAGVVAATVVTAVIVVTTFLAAIGVNLSLVMADMNSLTFRLEVVTEGEGKLEYPYYQAVLSGNGIRREMEVLAGDYFTFDGLEPNKEYLVTILDHEGAVQVEQTYCTAKKEIKKSNLEVYWGAGEVICFVSGVSLSSGEFYTVTAKDVQGKTLFVKDDVAKEKEYRFAFAEQSTVYVTLSVNGVVRAIAKAEWAPKENPSEPEEQYDYVGGTWEWSADGRSASLLVPPTGGGDPLTLPATVDDGTLLAEATCEAEGSIRYHASITAGGTLYENEKTVSLPALGHDYESVVTAPTCTESGYTTHTCSRCSASYVDEETAALGHDYTATFEWTEISDGYVSTLHLACKHDETHVQTVEEVTVLPEREVPSCEEDGALRYIAKATYLGVKYEDVKEIVLSATGHEYGDLLQSAATCETAGMLPHYYCAQCETFFDANRNVVEESDLVIPATGHDYAFTSFLWTPVYEEDESGAGEATAPAASDPSAGESTIVGYTAVARFTCTHDSEHLHYEDATVTYETFEETCGADAYRIYTASVTYLSQLYHDTRNQTFEGTALEHEYHETEIVEPTCTEDGYTVYTCSHCGAEYRDNYIEATVHDYQETEIVNPTCTSDGYTVYTCRNCGDSYQDDYIEAYGHDYTDSAPETIWTPSENDDYTATFILYCSHDCGETVEVAAEVSRDGDLYIATAEYNGVPYRDEYQALSSGHEHSFSYAALENVITATCEATDCDLTDRQVTLTLNAPELEEEGGEGSRYATLSDPSEFLSVTGVTVMEEDILYYYEDAQESPLSDAPRSAGSYVATITVEGETAYVYYVIDSASSYVSG